MNISFNKEELKLIQKSLDYHINRYTWDCTEHNNLSRLIKLILLILEDD